MVSSKKMGVLWDYEPHTAAKHRILRSYLDAWLPKLASIQRAKRVLFVDGFAGPGEYSKGEQGSPVIALRAALEHRARFQTKVRFAFIEADPARHAHLTKVIDAQRASLGISENKIEVAPPKLGACAEVLGAVLDQYEARNDELGPALFFLDQFGYSEIPLDLVRRILAHRFCEVFAYMHAQGMTRFLEKGSIAPAIDAAFGSSDWTAARAERTESARARVLAEHYERALRERAGARYVWRFAIHGTDDRILYWLFFATNSLDGLEVMKRAMLKVDTSGATSRTPTPTRPGR